MNNTETFKAFLQNPDLSFKFIKDYLAATKEAKAGKLTPYIRGKR